MTIVSVLPNEEGRSRFYGGTINLGMPGANT